LVITYSVKCNLRIAVVGLHLKIVDDVSAAGDFFSLGDDLLFFSFALYCSVQSNFAFLILHRHIARERLQSAVRLERGTNLFTHPLIRTAAARAALCRLIGRARRAAAARSGGLIRAARSRAGARLRAVLILVLVLIRRRGGVRTSGFRSSAARLILAALIQVTLTLAALSGVALILAAALQLSR